jgi:hypothetical protein
MLSVRLRRYYLRVVTPYQTWQETFTEREWGATVHLWMEYGEDSGLDNEEQLYKRALGEVQPMNFATVERYKPFSKRDYELIVIC